MAVELERPRWWTLVLHRAERLVFDAPVAALLAAMTVIPLLKDGFGSTPNLRLWLGMAQRFPDRTAVIPKGGNYLYNSPIGPAVAHVIGADTHASYVALHVVVVIAVVAVLVVGLHRKGGRAAVGVGLTALFASALSNILPSWLGLEDPWTVGFASMLVLFDSPIVLLIAAVGVTLSHGGLGLIIVGAVILLRYFTDGPQARWRRIVPMAAGWLVAAVAVAWYSHHAGAGNSVNGELDFIRFFGIGTLLRWWLSAPFTWLFSCFGAWWLTLGMLGKQLLAGKQRWALLLLVVAGVLLTFITADQTRIFVLVTWPGVLWLSVRSLDVVPRDVLRRVTTLTFLAAVVLPRVWVEAGQTFDSFWGHLL